MKENMNSVDKFVRRNILTYPGLFRNRTSVLHHALCVIGNGYKWNESGEVVSEFDSDREAPNWTKESELAELETWMSKSGIQNEHIRALLSESLRKEIEFSEQVVAEVDTRMYERAAIESFYPQCKEYALLMNIPSNVTPEWKEACEEMKQLAEKAGWVF
jgi:hypothetical protein